MERNPLIVNAFDLETGRKGKYLLN